MDGDEDDKISLDLALFTVDGEDDPGEGQRLGDDPPVADARCLLDPVLKNPLPT